MLYIQRPVGAMATANSTKHSQTEVGTKSRTLDAAPGAEISLCRLQSRKQNTSAPARPAPSRERAGSAGVKGLTAVSRATATIHARS